MKVIIKILGISKSPKNKQVLAKSNCCMTSSRWQHLTRSVQLPPNKSIYLESTNAKIAIREKHMQDKDAILCLHVPLMRNTCYTLLLEFVISTIIHWHLRFKFDQNWNLHQGCGHQINNSHMHLHHQSQWFCSSKMSKCGYHVQLVGYPMSGRISIQRSLQM